MISSRPLGSETTAVTVNLTVFTILGSGLAVGLTTVEGTITLPSFGLIFPNKKVDESETSIESSLSTIKLKRTFSPTLNVASSYNLKFSNEIFHPQDDYVDSVISTQFSHFDSANTLQTGCSITDTNGVLQVYRTSAGERVTVANNVGTVTYASGLVALSSFRPIAITDGTSNVEVTVGLASSDVKPVRDQILLITNNNISVTMIDTAGTGTDTSGSVTSSVASGSTSGGTGGSGGSGSSY